MRASFTPDLQIQDDYVLTGDQCHHLVNVVRVSPGEELLLLDGKGLRVSTLIKTVSKKLISLEFKEQLSAQIPLNLELALGMPKREALEICLKEATELGFQKIYLIKSQYSQMRFPEKDRIQNLLISALEQANNAYLPEVIEASWNDLPWDDYSTALWLDSQNSEQKKSSVSKQERKLLIVGPEGGFSEEEMEFFRSKPVIESLRLPTPILRTATAVATGAGILLQRLMD